MATLLFSSFSALFILVLVIVSIHCGVIGEDRKMCTPQDKAREVRLNSFGITSMIMSGTSKSTRDLLGHETHTTSTVAGNLVPDVGFYGLAKGNARGEVPSARIVVYKFCSDSKSCNDSDVLTRFDDAIADGVDIISISLAATEATVFYSDSIAIGAFHAMKKVILTSHSTGNDGPSKQTTVLHHGYYLLQQVVPIAKSLVRFPLDETVLQVTRYYNGHLYFVNKAFN
ncbi:hypothetical protein NE237_003808 [Protea cynaroides]|uniref:Peptidase S8/S53 domain-containing protein n=1 Tax=Protea cynaroides TaxID=273540 RepID=A0A9Q0QT29_9MAGN|nr:hypothetical protein NE237_003808 [Protea cynaroides]